MLRVSKKGKKKMKCFYHSVDLDGHCSGAIVKLEYPECEMFGINYGQAFPWDKVKGGEKIFMVDFALQPFDNMERLDNKAHLVWIDHHKSAIDEAHKRGFIARGGQVLEVGKAACELVWEYMRPEIPTPPAVTYLGRYDVWDHSDNPKNKMLYGDNSIAYPGSNGEVVATKHFEAFREGIEDYCYLYLLKREIEKAEKNGRDARKSKALLEKCKLKVV